jgi:hypothetical protein
MLDFLQSIEISFTGGLAILIINAYIVEKK